jgi:predicted transcriptional regulator
MTVPKRGWQKELAKLAGCTPQTVVAALHHGAVGKKADRVRRLYNAKYNQ